MKIETSSSVLTLATIIGRGRKGGLSAARTLRGAGMRAVSAGHVTT